MLGNDAMKFLKTLHNLDEIWNKHEDSEYNDRQLTQFAERYHEHKLKLLGDAMDKEQNLEDKDKALHIADVMRCFSMKEDELRDSIKYDTKYFCGNNVSKLTERLNAIEDLRNLVNRVVLNCA